MTKETHQGSPQGFDVHVDWNVMIPMRDGTRLATNIYRPSLDDDVARGPFPALVERTPYDKNQKRLHMSGMFLARFGYVVAVQDCRGRYDSEGAFDTRHLRSEDEGPDGYDTIEWLAEQEWCTGKVGTIGISQTGQNQQAAAVLNPPSLASQFIGDCALNNWRSPVRQNGALSQGITFRLALRMARHGPEALRTPRIARLLDREWKDVSKYHDSFPIRRGQTPLALVPAWEDWYFDVATRSDFDDFWSEDSSNQDKTKANWKDVPICFTTGWYGHHLGQNLEKYEFLSRHLKSPVKLFVGPWIHMNIFTASWSGDIEFGVNAHREDLDWLRLRWFDATLKDLNSGIRLDSEIEYFLMGGGTGEKDGAGRLLHGGGWERSATWPPPETEPYQLHLSEGGGLREDVPNNQMSFSEYVFDPAHPVPTVGGNFHGSGGVSMMGEGGPFDQRGHPDLLDYCVDELPLGLRNDVLVFQTPKLKRPVDVIGNLVVKLWISSSTPDTDFTAKLIDVYPDSDDYPRGYAMNIQDAIVRARYRGGRKIGELLEPGAICELEIPLQATANRFEVGHRIRLDISSSNFPLYDVNSNTGGQLGEPGPTQCSTNRIYHDSERPSHVAMMVRHRD